MKENNENTMNMEVTVTPLKDREGCLKANASVIFNSVFKVTGIRIGISKNGNTFVSMPDYKTGRLDDNGKEMYEEIVKEFNSVMEKEGQQEDDVNAKEEQHTEG